MLKNPKNKPYATCVYCGANLDRGERCDCRKGEPAVRLIESDEAAAEKASRKAWITRRFGGSFSESG